MKIVYVAHPIGGDVKNNLEKVREIIRHLNLTRHDVLPFAPYWVDCHALNDSIPEERSRGIMNNQVWLKRKIVDEVWLYGDKISNGMYGEILEAHHQNIKVIPMTAATESAYKEMQSIYAP